MTELTHLNSDTFDEFVRVHPHALILFWADFSGPDLLMLNLIKAKTSEFSERQIAVGNVDIYENDELCIRHRLRISPMTALYRRGQLQTFIPGIISAEKLATHLDELTGPSPDGTDSSSIP
jgi:thioredoxin 1